MAASPSDHAPDLVIEFAKRGSNLQIKELFDTKQGRENKDATGNTALHWACAGGHVDTVAELLSRGFNVNAQNKMGDTPLHKAAWKGKADVITQLLNAKANPDLKNNDGKLPLDLAKTSAVKMALLPAPDVDEDEYEDDSD